MMEQRAFKNYGKINIEPFKKILSEYEFDWSEFDFRQNRGHTHKETKCIPILFDESFSIEKKTATKHYELFKEQILKIENHLREIIEEDGQIFRAILVNLPKGKSIPPHIDSGESLVVPRRIHIAIQTNQNCFFTVGDLVKNLKEGEIWEIDNAGKMHSVSNEGDHDRIHLIVDFLNNEYLEKRNKDDK
jgi:quercetin dioxygenase-like cupin family protein